MPYNSLDEFTEPELMEAWAHILRDKGHRMCDSCSTIGDGHYCAHCGRPYQDDEGHECTDCAMIYFGDDVFYCKTCGKKIAIDEFEKKLLSGEVDQRELSRDIKFLSVDECNRILDDIEKKKDGMVQL